MCACPPPPTHPVPRVSSWGFVVVVVVVFFFFFAAKNAEMVAFTTWPGITGLIITIALIFMVTTAVEQIR